MLGDCRPLPNKNVQIWDQFFPLIFPRDSESPKILDIRLWEVGAKRRLNGTSKLNTQTDVRTDGRTDRHTDTQTDISTYRKPRHRGPMLWELSFLILKRFLTHDWQQERQQSPAGIGSTAQQNTAHCKNNTEQCTLYTAHCTLHTELHTAHCTLHTTHCTLPTAHCTLHTTHCNEEQRGYQHLS